MYGVVPADRVGNGPEPNGPTIPLANHCMQLTKAPAFEVTLEILSVPLQLMRLH